MKRIFTGLLYIFNLLTVQPALAQNLRPFWTEKSTYIEGEELKAVGIASNVLSREDGRQRAYENALVEIRNFFSTIGSMPQIQTQIIFEEENKDGTFNVYRLLRADLHGIEKKEFENKFTSRLGHQEGRSGHLKVITSPPGAEIFLDGDVIGRSNAEFSNVGSANYKLLLRLQNYQTKSIDIKISDNKDTVVKEGLQRKVAIVSIEGTYGAKVLVKETGFVTIIPGAISDLIVGKKYKLAIEKDGYFSQQNEIEVVDEFQKHLQVNLNPKPAEITVLSDPDGANVFIDGRQVGVTPLISLKVEPGDKKIGIEKAGYHGQSISVLIGPAEKKLVGEITLVSQSEKDRRISESPCIFGLGFTFAGPRYSGDPAGNYLGFPVSIEKIFSYGFGINLAITSESGGSSESTTTLYSTNGLEYSMGVPIYLYKHAFIAPELHYNSRKYIGNYNFQSGQAPNFTLSQSGPGISVGDIYFFSRSQLGIEAKIGVVQYGAASVQASNGSQINAVSSTVFQAGLQLVYAF